MDNQKVDGIKGDIRLLFSKYGTMKGRPGFFDTLRILITKPGVQAIIFYRFYRSLYNIRLAFIAEWLARINLFFNGAEIDPGADIGPGCRIWHSSGVVIGRGVKIGSNVSIFSNVTLGGLGHSIFRHGKKGYPKIGDNVILYANVTVVGPVTVGNNTTIGANSLVLKSIPPDCMAAGNPAKVIKR